MEYKTVFKLKTLAKERGLYGYSRLTKRELVQLLQRDLPSDCVRYDEYADSEFLVHFSSVNDDEYWKHRLLLKFGCQQLNVHKTAIYKNISKLIFIIKRSRRCFKFSYHVDEESQRAIDTELFNRYFLNNTSYL